MGWAVSQSARICFFALTLLEEIVILSMTNMSAVCFAAADILRVELLSDLVFQNACSANGLHRALSFCVVF